jgi:hypothetical protein
LVDDDEGLRLGAGLGLLAPVGVDGLVADVLLELDNLFELGVDEAALGFDELLALFGRGVEEARVDLGLFVFERDVKGEDVGVLEAFGHVRVPGTVIEDETTDETGVGVVLVLHLHDLDHVQVDRLKLGLRCRDRGGAIGDGAEADGEDGIDNGCGKRASEAGVDLGREGSIGDGDEGGMIGRRLVHLEGVEELRVSDHVSSDGTQRSATHVDSLLGSMGEAFAEDARVNALARVAFGLLEQLSDEEDDAGGAVAGLFVLGDSCPRAANKVSIEHAVPESCKSATTNIIAATGLEICISESRTLPSWRTA